MSKKKTTIPQPFKKYPEATAKYKIGQKVFVIHYYKGIADELIEGIVECVTTREYALISPLGKSNTVEYSYQYTIKTGGVPVMEMEEKVYPNYTEAAKVFAKGFLLLLK
jgi:hypothetical protein